MRILPIRPTESVRNSLRRQRGMMRVDYDKHTVIDSKTGGRVTLPPKDAWDLYDVLNGNCRV